MGMSEGDLETLTSPKKCYIRGGMPIRLFPNDQSSPEMSVARILFISTLQDTTRLHVLNRANGRTRVW